LAEAVTEPGVGVLLLELPHRVVVPALVQVIRPTAGDPQGDGQRRPEQEEKTEDPDQVGTSTQPW